MSGQDNVADCVVQHLPFLNRMVRGLTRCDPMSDDIVQQTILKALVHADQFRLESTLKTWLASIAINEVRQVYRCKWRTHSVPLITENAESSRFSPVESLNASYQAREREALVRKALSSPSRTVSARSRVVRSAVSPIEESRLAIGSDVGCRQEPAPASAKEVVAAGRRLEIVNRFLTPIAGHFEGVLNKCSHIGNAVHAGSVVVSPRSPDRR